MAKELWSVDSKPKQKQKQIHNASDKRWPQNCGLLIRNRNRNRNRFTTQAIKNRFTTQAIKDRNRFTMQAIKDGQRTTQAKEKLCGLLISKQPNASRETVWSVDSLRFTTQSD